MRALRKRKPRVGSRRSGACRSGAPPPPRGSASKGQPRAHSAAARASAPQTTAVRPQHACAQTGALGRRVGCAGGLSGGPRAHCSASSVSQQYYAESNTTRGQARAILRPIPTPNAALGPDWACGRPLGANLRGLLRELNPGPLAPEARIMPLDQAATGASARHLAIPSPAWLRNGRNLQAERPRRRGRPGHREKRHAPWRAMSGNAHAGKNGWGPAPRAGEIVEQQW